MYLNTYCLEDYIYGSSLIRITPHSHECYGSDDRIVLLTVATGGHHAAFTAYWDPPNKGIPTLHVGSRKHLLGFDIEHYIYTHCLAHCHVMDYLSYSDRLFLLS